MWMLTDERKNELLRQKEQKVSELDTLKRKTPGDLWRDDLDAFMKALDKFEENEKQEEANDVKHKIKKEPVSYVKII